MESRGWEGREPRETRNGYGPQTVIQPAGNASEIMAYARNRSETVNVDTRAIKRVLGSLQPQVPCDSTVTATLRSGRMLR
eukprot:3745254-Rhodomonas_salina.1